MPGTRQEETEGRMTVLGVIGTQGVIMRRQIDGRSKPYSVDWSPTSNGRYQSFPEGPGSAPDEAKYNDCTHTPPEREARRGPNRAAVWRSVWSALLCSAHQFRQSRVRIRPNDNDIQRLCFLHGESHSDASVA